MKKFLLLTCLLTMCLAIPGITWAQCTDCGTGADGVYNATNNTTLAGGTYNYTSFTIQAGVTVTVTGSQALIIRSTGGITINGTLTARGGNGADGVTYNNGGVGGTGVAGGGNGGGGSFASGSGPLSGVAGSGTGSTNNQGEGWSGGGGAGYATAGDNSGGVGGFGGPAYGNAQINPVVAGSGGGGGSGGYDCGAGGGGAGGGIVILTSCSNITVGAGGIVNANGGNGGSDGTGNCGGGGGGSGGSILLTAPAVSNLGVVSAVGGTGGASSVAGTPYFGTGANGSVGRIRIDGTFTGNATTPAAVAGTILTASASSSAAVNCSTQGQASVTAANGTTPYGYLWSNGATTSSISVSTAGNYTVTVTDNSGCEATATVTIADNSVTLTGNVDITDALCFGGATGSATANVTNGAPSYVYAWSPAGGTGSVASNLAAGSYTVSVTDANGCTGTFNGNVGQPGELIVDVFTDSVNCYGESNGSITLNISGGTATYTVSWSGGLNGTSPSNLAAGNYNYSVSDFNNCIVSGQAVVGQPDLFVININVTDVTCQGGNDGSADAVVVSGGTGGISYLWSSFQTTASVLNLAEGQIDVTGTDANGCEAAATSIVSFINTNPVVDLGNDVTQCGGPVSLDAQNSGSTYLWNDGSTTQTINVTATGTAGVTVTDANTCTASDVVNVTINALPVVDLGNDVIQCGGTATIDAQNGGSNYLWNDGSTTQTVNASTTGPLSVTVTDANDCSASDAVNVTINALPVVDLGNDVTQCGGTVTIDAQNAGATFLWSDGSTTQTITVTATGTVGVTVTDANTCTATDEADVTINAIPTVDLGNDVTQCGGTVTIDAQNAGATYLWSDGSTTQTITVTATGTVGVTVTDANTCTATDEADVTINAIPTVDLGNDVTQCGSSVSLDAQNAGSNFLWSDGSTTQTITVTATAAVGVTVTDANTCTATDNVDITINAMPTVDLGADVTQCGGAVILDAQNAGATYSWSDNSSNQTLTVSQTGTIGVTVTDANTCTASDDVDVTINAEPTVTFNLPLELCATAIEGLVATPSGGTFTGNGVSGSNLTVGQVGTQHIVTYAYTDGNNCSASVTDTVTSVICGGINEVSAGLNLSVYPNPNNGSFIIATETGIDADVTITNQLGQTVSVFALNRSNNYEVTVANMAAGTYYVTCRTENAVDSKKVLILN